MSHGACRFVVFLAELTDSIGTFQIADGLVVVRQERWIEVGEIIGYLASHHLMLFVETELFTIKQTTTEPREVVF